jgi:aerobic carbon-monoxide dehydrogenase small subunit
MDTTIQINCILNGQAMVLETVADRRVIDLLREDLGMTGSKEGCGTGECGACTILVDGLPKLACLMLAAQLEGTRVETVEALQQTEEGLTLMTAFSEEGAVQCGYCIPGMEMASLALVRQGEPLSREQIKEGLSGNLCRCTGYVKIVDAVERAARVKGEG